METDDSLRMSRLEELVNQSNDSIAKAYYTIKTFPIDEKDDFEKGFPSDDEHREALSMYSDFILSLLGEEDSNNKGLADFFLRLGEYIYRENNLKRADGSFSLSHHLFILNYLRGKGAVEDIKDKIVILAHDFFEDLIDIYDRDRIYKMKDQQRISFRDIGMNLLNDSLKNIALPESEKKRISGRVQALSRVRNQHYFDYLDSMLIFSFVEPEYIASSKKIVDSFIEDEMKSDDYVNEGIDGIMRKYFYQDHFNDEAYRLFEIKMTDRLHNILTLPPERFSNRKRLSEITKALYVLHLGKKMVQYGFYSLSKEYEKKKFRSFNGLCSYIENLSKNNMQDKRLKTLSRVGNELKDLAYASIFQSKMIKEELNKKLDISEIAEIEDEINRINFYKFDINKDKFPIAKKSIYTLFSWFDPSMPDSEKELLSDDFSYSISLFLEKQIEKYMKNANYFFDYMDLVEGRERFIYNQGKRLPFLRNFG